MTPGIYLDENVADGLGAALRARGLDLLTTTEAERKGATDPQQLLFALDTDRLLVTHNNADFRMLHEALVIWAGRWGVLDRVRHRGILIIDQGKPRRGGLSILTMVGIVEALATELPLDNRLFVWNDRLGLREDG